jgi:hypothetical protein
MTELPSVDWASLEHAYGSAEDIPGLLLSAETDTRAGSTPGSTWFDLWSALCHQGDSYTASYAAVPFLVRLAAQPLYRTQYEPLMLAASIEVSQMSGRGPSIPKELVVSHSAALGHGLQLALDAVKRPLDKDSRIAFRGCVAAFHGQGLTARNIWDSED